MIHQVTPTIHLSPIVPADRDDILSHVQDRELSRYTRVVPYPYPSNWQMSGSRVSLTM